MGLSGSQKYPQSQVKGLVEALADLQDQIDGISVGATEWGSIGGTLALQTDLQSALDGKLATGLAVLLGSTYSNPDWLTALAGSKISGNIAGNAAGLTATLVATSGGTGVASYAVGDVLYANALNTLATLAGNTTTTKKFLRQTGTGSASAAPAWDTVTKSDVGLSAVENTPLSTWGGSANIVTIGTLSKIDVVQYSQVMEITPVSISANEGLTIIHTPGGSSSAALIVKANGGETEIQTWADSGGGTLASVNSIGGFTGPTFNATGNSGADTIIAVAGNTARPAVRVVNKAGQTASLLQQYGSDNTTLLAEVDENGNASYANLIDPIVAAADGGASVLTAATVGAVTRPYAGTITSWQILSTDGTVGSITFSVKKYSFSDYQSGSAGTTMGSPALSSDNAASGTTSGWSATTIAAGDVIEIAITGTPASVKKVSLVLNVKRS